MSPKTQTRTLTIELGERKGAPTGAKTFSAIISTETPVKRKDWERGEHYEILSHTKGAIDLSRAPLPLIEAHDTRSLPIGVVDNLRIVDKKLRGEIRFGASARATEVAADVEAGIIRNLSVGYTIEAVTEKRGDDKNTTVTATKWTPHEVSAVAIGADSGAGFNRSYQMENEENNPQETETQTRAMENERSRCIAITRAAKVLKVDSATVADFIARGVSADEAKSEMLEGFEARSPNMIPDQHASPRMFPNDATAQQNDFRSAAVDAVLLRAGVQVKTPHPAARDVSASVSELARVCLSRSGISVSGSTEKLIKRAMSTSDFSYILQDATHKATLRGYEDEPSSHRQWVRTQPVQDFKQQNRAILGSAPALAQINEGGEYTHGSLSDGGASYTVAKYGKIVSITWEALVNDDLGALLRIQPAMGQAARRKEADLVYAMFAENAGAGPLMQDGVNLFHADHGNIATAGALSATTLGAARSILRKMTALGGGYLSLVPRHLIVPPELETEAEILLASATKHVSSVSEADTPKWLQNLSLVVEPRLGNDAFYLAADSNQVDTAELGLLEENMNGPVLEEEREFGRDVYAWKVRHVAGAKFLDWRGMVKVPLS